MWSAMRGIYNVASADEEGEANMMRRVLNAFVEREWTNVCCINDMVWHEVVTMTRNSALCEEVQCAVKL